MGTECNEVNHVLLRRREMLMPYSNIHVTEDEQREELCAVKRGYVVMM